MIMLLQLLHLLPKALAFLSDGDFDKGSKTGAMLRGGMLGSVIGLGSVDIRPQRRTAVLAGICPSGTCPTTAHAWEQRKKSEWTRCQRTEVSKASSATIDLTRWHSAQRCSRPWAQASGRPVGQQKESRWSCETASPGSGGSWAETILTECEQAGAAEVCMACEAWLVLLKLPYAGMRSVAYPASEGSSPAGAADNISDKCHL